jgi:alpha-glucosidase (family GH31 glycosyl hydrolase)
VVLGLVVVALLCPAVPTRADGVGGVTLRVAAAGYTVEVGTRELAVVTRRAGRIVLASAPGGFRFRAGGGWQHATGVTGWRRGPSGFVVTARTTLPGATVSVRISPSPGRYRLDWNVTGARADRLGLVYDLSSGGHWYGHGEAVTPRGGPTTDQPWPLDAGEVEDPSFGPDSYDMVDPFWFTATAAGLRVDTDRTMDVGINRGHDGLGRFTVDSGGPYRATVFVASTPLGVYRDEIGVVGRPARSDATYAQYATPLWNTWAQFYTHVTQQGLLAYAAGLRADGLDGHALQLDDRWESAYGDLAFDRRTFPDPRAMSARLHRLGFRLGVWVTLWVNRDSVNYRYAADHGYLLRSAGDPHRPCTVHWWNGTAGIVDLAVPAARAWYEGNLAHLMSTDGIDGLKFDTRFFDPACASAPGRTAADYQRLGAELADRYDLQGAGIRVHWTGAAHRAGFVTREIDKGTGWESLRAAAAQDLALSVIGYPFTESDMIGGSGGQPPPGKEVLVRWAEAASLMPLMYASTSPAGTTDVTTGRRVVYDPETAALYRAAVRLHERLAPYLWDQVRATLRTGDPLMRPLFFDFPQDQAGYTVADEWLLGPAVLAAPQLAPGTRRTVHLPPGRWYDVSRRVVRSGPVTLTGYAVPLGATPAFVRLGAPDADKALRALRPSSP